jgi:MSHA pilin protein MshD
MPVPRRHGRNRFSEGRGGTPAPLQRGVPPEFGGARRHLPQRGFSLVEVVIATLVVGLVMVAALNSVGAYIRGQQHVANRGRAVMLANDLMTEILTRSYEEPDDSPVFGPEPGEGAVSRADYDDVDDYHGLNNSPPLDRNGAPLAGGDPWQRAVTVEYVDPDSPGTTVGSDQGVKRITVTVYRDDTELARLVTLRARAWQNPPFE